MYFANYPCFAYEDESSYDCFHLLFTIPPNQFLIGILLIKTSNASFIIIFAIIQTSKPFKVEHVSCNMIKGEKQAIIIC